MFYNGSAYDYHFIIKELAKEFEGQFECLGENTVKYITFSIFYYFLLKMEDHQDLLQFISKIFYYLQYHLKKTLIIVKQLHTK